jgi:hemerythrin superfamily protein
VAIACRRLGIRQNLNASATQRETRLPDIVEALRLDHRSIVDMLRRFESLGAEDRSAWFDRLRQVLVRHEAAEEQTVYPAVGGEALPDHQGAHEKQSASGGPAASLDQAIDDRLAEQAEAHDLIARLETVNSGTEEFRKDFLRLRGAVLDHVEQEERSVIRFIELDKSLDQRDEMGRHYDRAKHGGRRAAHPIAR